MIAESPTPRAIEAEHLHEYPSGGFWSSRWEYPQAVTIAIGLIGAGMILQAMNPSVHVQLPHAPYSWLLVFGPLGALAVMRRVWPENLVLNGLGSIPMAIVSVLSVAVLSIPAAIWPQGEQAPGWAHSLGLHHVFASFGFAAAIALMLINLALAVGKRCWPIPRNTRFLLLHGGLLLAVGSSVAGSSSLIRARMVLSEGGDPSSTVLIDGTNYHLPFAVRLTDFRKESFPPTLSLATRNPSAEYWDVSPGSVLMAEGKSERLGGYRIDVEEYHRRALVVAGIPRETDLLGAGPAARVSVTDATGTPLGEGWVHAESRYGEELFLQVSPDHVILMNPPRARSYESHVEVLDHQKRFFEAVVGVNQPLWVSGWYLYQLSYDAEAGEASSISILEAVCDPAYPAVATGFWMVILGSCWFLWGAAANLSGREGRK